MKRVLSFILAVMAAFTLAVPAFAAENPVTYSVMVNDRAIDLSDLPVAPYEEGTTVMVPLRKISEALNYRVDWNAKTQDITVDDEYIQKAVLREGTDAVVFEGRLTVINMDREIKNAAPTVIHEGYTYVPLEFFREFFNDTAVNSGCITISPSRSELQTNAE